MSRQKDSCHVATVVTERISCQILYECLDGDCGEAAHRHLAAGRPVYYGDPAYPDAIIKKYPGGRRELIVFDEEGRETVVRGL